MTGKTTVEQLIVVVFICVVVLVLSKKVEVCFSCFCLVKSGTTVDRHLLNTAVCVSITEIKLFAYACRVAVLGGCFLAADILMAFTTASLG